MIKIIDFIKGNEVKGSIMQLEEKSFTACTGTQSKSYKTEKGARKFMETNGYIEVADVKMDTVGNVVEVIGLGEVEVVTVEDNLVGLNHDIVAVPCVEESLKNYLNEFSNTDKWDFIDDVNKMIRLFGEKKIILIDGKYSTDRDKETPEGLKVGTHVKSNGDRLFNGEATVLGIDYHVYTKRYLVALSNGDEWFADELTIVEEAVEPQVEVVDTDRLELRAEVRNYTKEEIIEVFDTVGHRLLNEKVLIELYPSKNKFHVEIIGLLSGASGYGIILSDKNRLGQNKKWYIENLKAFTFNPTEEDINPPKDKFNIYDRPKKDITGFEACPHCNGTGVNTSYMYHDNGFCYKCMGTGKGKKIK